MGVRYIFGQDGAFRTEPVIVAKNITTNGTYDPATEGADGYAPVTVNVGGGGGGSSDFSTAEVTLNLTPPEGVTLVSESVLTSVSGPGLNYVYQCGNVTANNHIVTLLINTAELESEGFCQISEIFAYDSEDNEYVGRDNVTVTGDIIYDSTYGIFRVNGNGTISADLS